MTSTPTRSRGVGLDVTVRRLRVLGLLGLLHFAGEPFEWTRYLLLFLVVPLLADAVRWVRRKSRGSERSVGATASPPAPPLPLPGPAARGGALRYLLRHHLSSALGLLNPRQLVQVVRQARGQSRALARAGSALPEAGRYEQKVVYTLPFRGEWLVVNGGTTPETSHSWDILSQRFAYDFVRVDEADRLHRGDGSRPADYFAYGQPVLAVAGGEVVRVVDGIRDAPGVGTGWVDWRTADIAGNSVTIRHADGEYSLSAHLVPGSIRVRVGDRVRRGEEIGRCGHSGRSTEPHLHFQVQDDPDFFRAIGLPVRFSGVVVDGVPSAAAVYLSAGMRVRAGEGPERP